MKMTLDGKPFEPPPAVLMLPPKDQAAYFRDLHAFGFAMVRSNDDGTVTYIPPSTWLKIGERRRFQAWALNMAYAAARSVLIATIIGLGLVVLLGLWEPRP